MPAKSTSSAVGTEDPPDLEPGRGDRGGPGQLGAGATTSRLVSSLIPVQTTSAVVKLRGHAADDVSPVRVAVLADHLAGGPLNSRISLWSRDCTTISRSLPQAAVTRYGKRARSQATRVSLTRPRARPASGVLSMLNSSSRPRPPCGSVRVAMSSGRRRSASPPRDKPPLRALARVGRVGDVPARHRRLVHPRDEDGLAVGGPPVTPGTVHLLGGDELRRGRR